VPNRLIFDKRQEFEGEKKIILLLVMHLGVNIFFYSGDISMDRTVVCVHLSKMQNSRSFQKLLVKSGG